MAKFTYIEWKDADFQWNNALGDKFYKKYTKGRQKYTWDEVFLVRELSTSAESPEILWQDVNNLDPEKKKRFIKLVCKVKGEETYSGQKTIRDDIEISVEDVELVLKEVLGIDLTVENIHV